MLMSQNLGRHVGRCRAYVVLLVVDTNEGCYQPYAGVCYSTKVILEVETDDRCQQEHQNSSHLATSILMKEQLGI